MLQTGILLVNLGTPDSPSVPDVKKYLVEFLTDPRVIDAPWALRQFLVRGVIIPRRVKESAANYARIWSDEGSPLMAYGSRVQSLLQQALGSAFHVELAMRYQSPSIREGLGRLSDCGQIIVIPLFPQYASATTGSVHQKVMEEVKDWTVIPPIEFIQSYPDKPAMIEAFAERGREFSLSEYDHFLMSFHGLPEKHIRKADKVGCCLQKGCCGQLTDRNLFCYAAQCHATARAIAEKLDIVPSRYSIAFQSRLGKDPWIRPYTQDTVEELAEKGIKRLLVFCPAFVCDCLETIDEIGRELRHTFLERGGEQLDLVPGLNDHPLWIRALADLAIKQVPEPALL